jgi:hypothetical protein
MKTRKTLPPKLRQFQTLAMDVWKQKRKRPGFTYRDALKEASRILKSNKGVFPTNTKRRGKRGGGDEESEPPPPSPPADAAP